MKQAIAVRLFLVGLPLGLLLTSAASLLWHFRHPAEEETPGVFTTLAEEITPAQLSSFARNLSEIIGPRHLSQPETLERTANYLESTLGPRNIGFNVAHQPFTVGGENVRNLWVEIPGSKRRNECIVLFAHYDAPAGQRGANQNASGVAALLGLAENFVAESPILTIRLAFLANGTPPYAGTEDAGAAHFAKHLSQLGDQVRAAFGVDSIGAFPATPTVASSELQPYLPSEGPFISVWAAEQSAALSQRAMHALGRSLPFTVHQSLVPTDSLRVAQAISAFQEQGFPTALIVGNGFFAPHDHPVDPEALTEVTRALATLVRLLANP